MGLQYNRNTHLRIWLLEVHTPIDKARLHNMGVDIYILDNLESRNIVASFGT